MKFPVRVVEVDVAGMEANRRLATHHKGGRLYASVAPLHTARCGGKLKRCNYTCTCGAEQLYEAWKGDGE